MALALTAGAATAVDGLYTADRGRVDLVVVDRSRDGVVLRATGEPVRRLGRRFVAIQARDRADVVRVTGPGRTFVGLGRGNDVAVTGKGRDIVVGGPGDDRISTGAGDDLVRAGGGRDQVDCGPGDDIAFVRDGDPTVNCETVSTTVLTVTDRVVPAP